MEYAGGGELFAKISNEGKLPEKIAKKIFSQIQSAVEHMVS
jgi:serine/threonine-protein kinase NIM1